MSIKDGGPAFPFSALSPEGPSVYVDNIGMTLRDYFAAQALIGMLSQPADRQNIQCYEDINAAARWAYGFADALLAERMQGDMR